MRTRSLALLLLGLLLWSGSPSAHGQKAVERFIPLGQSPGLSGTVTVIGHVETINAPSRVIAIAGPTEAWSAEITDRTKIWLDRSKLRLPTKAGTFNDLRQGLTVEVKYQDDAQRGKGQAEWIKVQHTKPPGS